MTIGGMTRMYSAYSSLVTNNRNIEKVQKQLASGLKINSAANDAAGLAISEGMRGQISGLTMAARNAQDGISAVRTADGALGGTSDVLNRMRELSVQAANGTLGDDDRALINREFQQLKQSIDQTAGSTAFNGTKLLDGSLGGKTGMAGLSSMGVSGVGATGDLSGTAKFTISTEDGVTSITAQIGGKSVTNQIAGGDASTTFDFGGGNALKMDFTGAGLKDGVISGAKVNGSAVDYSKAVSGGADGPGLTLQIGANGGADQKMSFKIGDMSSRGLGIADLDISTMDGANSAIDALTGAVNTVSSQRGSLGAVENRLGHAINSLTDTSLNTSAAESNIRDLDMAKAITESFGNNIKQQASIAMLSQSMNLSRNNVMSLLMR